MRRRIVHALAALAALVPGTAAAVLTPRPDTPPPAASGEARAQPAPRAQAEVLYADAYDEVARAKQDLAGGRAKSAEKRFRRALDRALRAAELDTAYHEAWNLAGYAARRLGDHERALAAYGRCLRLAPDYAAAREYLGEALVELGRLDEARAQLAWLERLGAKDEARVLRGALEAAAAKAVTPVSAPAADAPSDSSASK
uniref:Tetratricopeptide repeat protein n=1 Tax=Eiseniibacteriota bacterium TaxID=2212470 RepID=A0A832MKW4_UNCEI